MKYGILPMGTNAHEMFMVVAGLLGKNGSDVGIIQATETVLGSWWKQYGWGLSVALTDTFGTDLFFREAVPASLL